MNIFDVKEIQKQEGEVGIEIEVEGDNLPNHVVGWHKENDGSLRGESCEYVLKKPCARDKVNLYTNRIAKGYKDAGPVIHNSPRTSIHVHINVQDLTFTQIYNFMLLFLILEKPLVAFCGEERINNLFCLRSYDAEGLLTALEEAATPAAIWKLETDDIRYSAMNAASIFKYGSVEFRSMRGTKDVKLIQKWVRILLKLKDVAKGYRDPIELVEAFSFRGIDKWIMDVMGLNHKVVTERDGWEEDIFDSMRSVQSIAYSGDWEGLSADAKWNRIPVDIGPMVGRVIREHNLEEFDPEELIDEEDDEEHEGEW